MRTIVIIPITLATLSLSGFATHAEYVGSAWCANRSDGSTNCGYSSWEQCRANSSINTNCTSNQWYTGNGGNARRRGR